MPARAVDRTERCDEGALRRPDAARANFLALTLAADYVGRGRTQPVHTVAMTNPRDPRRSWRWQKQRERLLRLWGPLPTCWRCGEPIVVGPVVAAHLVDHALGGTAHWSNLAPECLPCSRRSGVELRGFIYGPWRGRTGETPSRMARPGIPAVLAPPARPAPEPEPPMIF